MRRSSARRSSRLRTPVAASLALGLLVAACATAESEASDPPQVTAGAAGEAGSAAAGASGKGGKAGTGGSAGATAGSSGASAGQGGSDEGGAAGSAGSGEAGKAGTGGSSGTGGSAGVGGKGGSAGVSGASGAGGASGKGGSGGSSTAGAGGASGSGGAGGSSGTGGASGSGGAAGAGTGGAAGAGPAGLGKFWLSEVYVDMCGDGDATEWLEIQGNGGDSTINLMLRIFAYEDGAASLKYTVNFGDETVGANGYKTIGGGLSPSTITVGLSKWGLPEKGYVQLVDKATNELYDTLGYGDVPAIEADPSVGGPLQLVFGKPAARTDFDKATCGKRTISRKSGSERTDNSEDYCVQVATAEKPNAGVCEGGGAGGAGGSGGGGAGGSGGGAPDLGTFALSEVYVDMCGDGDNTEWVEIQGPPAASTSDLALRIFSYDTDTLKLKYTVDFGDKPIGDNGFTSIGGALSPSKISVSISKWGLPDKGYIQLVGKANKELYDTIGYGDVPTIEADAAMGAPLQLVYGTAAARTAFDNATCGARTISRKDGSGRTNNHDDYCVQLQTANQPNDGTCQ